MTSPADFLGCGYRVAVPVPEAVGFAQDQARQVLDRLGIAWSPWPTLPRGPVEVTGGAAYDAGRRAFGPTLVRVDPLPAPTAPSGPLVPVDLPWWWSSEGPLAGLPTLSALEDTLAARHLAPGTAGLWWNHRDELCTSTAGPLLLRLADRWVHPDDAAAAVPSWAWAEQVRARGATPARVDRALLAAADEVIAVSPLGAVVTVGPAPG